MQTYFRGKKLNLNNLMLKYLNKFAGFILIFSAIVLSPFYFYASGLPQPAHILMFIAAIFIIAVNFRVIILEISKIKIGLLFLILITLINLIYAIYYQDKIFIINTSYWIYGFLLLFSIICIKGNYVVSKWVSRLILIKFLVIALSYILGLGGYLFWPRYDYFFNGPNQLAYFVICFFTVYLAITQSKFNWELCVVTSLAFFIIISTGGRSAYLAIVPIFFIMLFIERKNFKNILFLFFMPFVVVMLFNYFNLPNYKPNNGESKVNLFENNEVKSHESGISIATHTGTRIIGLSAGQDEKPLTVAKSQLIARGYMRALDYPIYLIFGAGQGKDDRFENVDGNYYEIHSSLLSVWFYYGILGISLFLWFIWNLFTVKVNILLLSPIFIYGLFTYGLRAPYFWIALAFLALAPNLLSQNIVINEEK